MARLLSPELQEMLRADADVRIMFVEGSDDLTLWRSIVPERERGNTVVWPIDTMSVEVEKGGSKSRVCSLAAEVLTWPEHGRIIFFADADFDRLLGYRTPANVVLTDGRDAESYGFEEATCVGICRIGCSMSQADANSLFQQIGTTLRPLAMLRLMSEAQGLRLPFQATLEDGSLKRFLKTKRGRHSIILDNLVDALLGRMEAPPSKQIILDDLKAYLQDFASITDFEVLHGKDCVAYLASVAKIHFQVASGLVLFGSAAADLRRHRNIGFMHCWCVSP